MIFFFFDRIFINTLKSHVKTLILSIIINQTK